MGRRASRDRARRTGLDVGIGVAAGAFLALVLLTGVGCPKREGPRAARPDELEEVAPLAPAVLEERTLTFELPSGEGVELGASLHLPPGEAAAPAVVFVPGAGSISRAGTRPSDGVTAYPAPIDVGADLQRMAAEAGWLALAYDKRTCAPANDGLCRLNPQTDLDVEGPRALTRDVDAACALVESEPRFDGRLVLWGHGQSTQVVLASSCAERAAAIVLVAPIPRRVDNVMLAALEARRRKTRDPEQKNAINNQTGSLEAMFEAMRSGQFDDAARVKGATLAFWREWITLTDEVPGPEPAPAIPWVVALGARDVQYGPTDRERISAWAAHDNIRLLEVAADHHLVDGGAVSAPVVQQILDAATAALRSPAAHPGPPDDGDGGATAGEDAELSDAEGAPPS